MLADAHHLAGADAASADLWRWHAAEEIEHKGVAYDTWLHATRDWPRSKRWKVKAKVMLIRDSQLHRRSDRGRARNCCARTGITGPRAVAGCCGMRGSAPACSARSSPPGQASSCRASIRGTKTTAADRQLRDERPLRRRRATRKCAAPRDARERGAGGYAASASSSARSARTSAAPPLLHRAHIL